MNINNKQLFHYIDNIKFVISLFVIILFFSWVFLYLPAVRKFTTLKGQLIDIEQQIEQIESIFDKTNKTVYGLQMLERRYLLLDSKFPEREEQSIQMLSNLAKNTNIGIVSVRQQPKQLFIHDDEEEITVKGKTCQKVSITMELKTGFKDLVDYISTIKEKLPAFVTVEDLRISKESPGLGQLQVRLGINLYLLS